MSKFVLVIISLLLSVNGSGVKIYVDAPDEEVLTLTVHNLSDKAVFIPKYYDVYYDVIREQTQGRIDTLFLEFYRRMPGEGLPNALRMKGERLDSGEQKEMKVYFNYNYTDSLTVLAVRVLNKQIPDDVGRCHVKLAEFVSENSFMVMSPIY